MAIRRVLQPAAPVSSIVPQLLHYQGVNPRTAGDVETGLVFTGANMWKIKEILPVKEIFRRLKEDIEKI